ncbi:MAG: winged helix-turn-helix domain-containing protein [Sphingopyxis macrogoltabida]|uniref:Winged helix-turn-helix domain-containing protein n=1 Tax=Sphingopyxis macrogoltabida TaxID=33050 RepID=A0A2W5MMN6_SPHMC|nr:MAG: winged helix-turn-helix domain-containing protein [Sphingopyxis macrogoltabida]
MMQRDENLLKFATDRQAAYLEAAWATGSFTAAAEIIGINKSAVARGIRAVEKKAARQGYAPGHFINGVAPGFAMGKVTVQRGASGEVERTWERQSPDAAALREAVHAILSAAREELPRAEAVTPPTATNASLCNVYTLTDAHIGALAWHREGGADWDLAIAERTILAAFRHMIDAAPPARMGVVAFLGDVMHQDSNRAVTPAHGHLLDADSRPRKVVSAVVRIMRSIIAMALERHEAVHVVVGEGNHDEYTSGTVLPEVFGILYENEPRVVINDSVLPYYAFRWGKVMLAWHHGHKRPPAQLPLYFAAAQPEMWGVTTKRYVHCGHRHHVEEKEHSGMKAVQHSTLAARDAHAARGGWFSDRQAMAITYHADFGEVSRLIVTPEMLADAA